MICGASKERSTQGQTLVKRSIKNNVTTANRTRPQTELLKYIHMDFECLAQPAVSYGSPTASAFL